MSSMADERGAAQPHDHRPDEVAPQLDLTIGDLAERTGLSPAVLRMWESRHGFPVPRRMPSGHRRYSEDDVDLVRRVLRRKEAGTRLEVAIAEAADATAPRATSVFAELRRRHPALVVQRLHKRTLVALSRAIEDECFAAGEAPVVFGAFQRSRFYRPSSARWAELARVARTAIVFADQWPESDAAAAAAGPVRVTLPENAAMRREWVVVCDGGESTACLAAWELPGQGAVPDRERLFEAVWTLDPAAVRDAARVAAGVAAQAGAPGADRLLDELGATPLSGRPVATRGEALFGRALQYLDHLPAAHDRK